MLIMARGSGGGVNPVRSSITGNSIIMQKGKISNGVKGGQLCRKGPKLADIKLKEKKMDSCFHRNDNVDSD